MKLSTIVTIASVVVGAVAAAVCIHSKSDTDVEATDTTTDAPTEEPTAETTAEA